MVGLHRGDSLGLEMGRNTWLLHAGICYGCSDCSSGLGNNSASRKSLRDEPDRLHTPRMLTADSAVSSSLDTWRERGMGIFSDTAGLVIAGNPDYDVYIFADSEGQKGLTWNF